MHLRAPFEAVVPLKWYHMQLEIDILEGHCRAEGITAFHLRNKPANCTCCFRGYLSGNKFERENNVALITKFHFGTNDIVLGNVKLAQVMVFRDAKIELLALKLRQYVDQYGEVFHTSAIVDNRKAFGLDGGPSLQTFIKNHRRFPP